MSDYDNLDRRLVDMGLNLRDDPDRVKEGFFTRLVNVVPTQEGGLNTRTGRTLQLSPFSTEIHTLFKIDSGTTISAAGTGLARNNTLYGVTLSGQPLTYATAKPPGSTAAWTYLSDGTTLLKIDATGQVYGWGIAAPTVSASGLAFGAGLLNSSAPGAIVYDWRYTYYSTFTGAESNPSPVMSGIAAVNQQVTVGYSISADPQVDTVKIYRRGGVNGGTTWRFVGSTPNVAGTFNDNNSDSDIALSAALELDNYVPFTSVDSSGNAVYGFPLPYIWGTFLGKFIFGTGDPNRAGEIYWTNSERPDSSDVSNHVTITRPNELLIGGFIYGSLPYVYSKENIFAIDFGGPDAIPTFTGRKTPTGRGVATPYAVAVGPKVVFVSGDGIYETDLQSPPRSLTEESLRPLFLGFQIEDMLPVDWSQPNSIRLFWTGRDYHFFYQDTGGARRHFVYDQNYERWHLEESTAFVESVVFFDETQTEKETITGTTAGNIYVIDGLTDAGQAIRCVARIGSDDFGMPNTFKEFGNLLVDADPGGVTISVTPLVDAEATAMPTQFLLGGGRAKFPLSLVDTYGHSLGVEFTWSGQANLYQLTYLYRLDEEGITHWEYPPTCHGYPGWQMVRDVYIALRSTTAVTLTVEVDGLARTYSIPSTGGARLKQHVWLDALKGKMWRYSLDSDQEYRLYGEDCEVRVKPWNTAIGYQFVSPFRTGSQGATS